MTQVLCFLVPSFICVSGLEKIQKKQLDWKKFLVKYMIFTGVINMLCFGVITIFFQRSNHIINSNFFSVSFVLKYLLLSFAIVAMLLCLYIFYLKYNCIKKNDIVFANKQKIILSAVVSLFFSFTIVVFTPYDIFFGNQSDFVFGFSDFWWIMASFGLIIFAILTVVFMILPVKVFAVSLSVVFSFTLCAYIQRMFLNLYITSMVGEKLNTGNHPIWGMINLIIWCFLFLNCLVFLRIKAEFWKRGVTILSIGLISIQLIALSSILITGQIKSGHINHLTKDGLFEMGSHNNVIVFILDYYDYSYVEAVKTSEPTFYDSLEGFTLFDNTSAVYSRSYPANTYLLTGKELPEYHIEDSELCIEKAFADSTFFPDLQKLGFKINVYTDERFVGSQGKKLVDNFLPQQNKLKYGKTVVEMLRCSLYFEVPYVIKPFFWFYNEFNAVLGENNLYVMNDAKFYQELLDKKLFVSDFESSYKYIHMTGGHSPYTLNENGERVEEGVTGVEQWKGCINIVKEYLNQMKELEIYKDATIIITADHGEVFASNTAVSPILFVKPTGIESGTLVTSHAPVSHTDIFPTIIQAANGDFEKYGTPIFETDNHIQRKRIFHRTAFGSSGKESEVVDYEILGDVKQFENWKQISSKKVQNSMYAVEK